MKLWLIYQGVNNKYDTYDSAVVAAETEEEARLTFPGDDNNSIRWNGSEWMYHLPDSRVITHYSRSWVTPDHVVVEFLADGYNGKVGTVVASFNAG